MNKIQELFEWHKLCTTRLQANIKYPYSELLDTGTFAVISGSGFKAGDIVKVSRYSDTRHLLFELINNTNIRYYLYLSNVIPVSLYIRDINDELSTEII